MKRISFFLLLIFGSCGQKTELSSDETQNLSSLPQADLFSDGRGELIKKAELRFQVTDLKKSREAIDLSIRKFSGFIASADLKYESPILEEHLAIRVLSSDFEPLLKEIEQQAAYLNYRKITSDDVEKEFVDLESRLKSKREMEERYADIVRKKVNTTEDLLKAEHEIGELHEEIEVVVSRINFLKDQVRYSTIKLELYQVQEQQSGIVSINKPFGNQFTDALLTGLHGLTRVLIALTNIWPILFLGFGGVYYWMRIKKMAS
jgi:hypothetical protein